ncbi:putative TetR family transcriptional regulator [Gordonia hirsuta DSM 44140 = NBRC 16056]|uniref:Putative TetR family transcriptional regulator n=1 Tax=Gordonia hirsuta DSM 44140 = NBRC 16056 TaxID=1121927 RepID=L7LC27_9ACTN|nr:TetR/AcrR family transcriptional regulator [Gordonia hirsuta]GAC58301.1 putative TetR family transcriptional regulator [Gordonia hirsuta DSM 44140 = NBRC 16056]
MSSADHESAATQTSPLRERFLQAGMRVLARDGYPGFKQAAVCAETGLTTGAFYHSFRNWKQFETALISHWRTESTDQLVAWLDIQPASAERVDALIRVALDLPHRSEAAIRVWAAGDAQVRSALEQVDAVRREAVARYSCELGVAPEHAARLASTAMLLLIGHEMGDGPLADLEWSMRHLMDTDPHVQAALANHPVA